MENSLKNIFERIGLNTKNGLIYQNTENSKINARIKYSLQHIDYDALYALDNNPLIIFKEYTNINDYENNYKKLLNQIWNLNDIPILFICRPDQIEIYNANIFDENESRLAIFKEIDDLTSFNIDDIVNGSFFTDYKDEFNKSKKVQDYLLNNISQTKEILSNNNLDNNIIYGLIGKLIFSKYLIDRKIIDCEDDEFYNIIENKQELFNFFNQIETQFNLDLFKLNENDKTHIKKEHLKSLSDLFRGHDIVNQQEVLFCPYDFSIIPIELISNIYEIFLEDYDETKSFYTPLFLVDYMLDRTLDVKLEKNDNCKILDPSCGSGVFLVESLRRIINKHLKSIDKLSNDELINIVKNNIYGVDKDKNAIYLTILSITLTVFDYLDTSEINSFQMPTLFGENLFNDDFFNEKGDFNKLNNFDLIIGNPPWGREDTLHLKYSEENDIPISNNEISQTFAIRVKDFANAETKIALIIPSKTLYNSRAQDYRNLFLNSFNLEKVLELSTLRKSIFKNAIQPPCILFYDLNVTKENKVEHNSLKPNKLFYFLRNIVIQKLDIKYVKQTDLIEHDWMWKFLLYGNILDFQLIRRLKKITPLKEIIENNKLLPGTGVHITADSNEDASKYFTYNYLDIGSSKKMLKRYYIDESDVSKWKEPLVNSTRNEKLFEPPYVLVKTGINPDNQCVSAFSNKQWVFKNSVISIKGAEKDITLLKSIVGILNSKLFTYFAFLTSSSIGVERPFILEKEFLETPIIENEKIAYYVDKLSNERNPEKIKELQDKLDNIIFDLIGLDEQEIDLINYFPDIITPMLKSKAVLKEDNNAFRNVNKKELETYAELFLNHFKHYFNENNDEYLHSEIYVSDNFIGLIFKIDENAPSKLIEFKEDTEIINLFGNLSIIEENTLYVQKDIKGFTENSFYVIKSNEYKNWHPAIARLDIVEFMNKLLDMGNK